MKARTVTVMPRVRPPVATRLAAASAAAMPLANGRAAASREAKGRRGA
jgi:hypothetical protein